MKCSYYLKRKPKGSHFKSSMTLEEMQEQKKKEIELERKLRKEFMRKTLGADLPHYMDEV